MTGLWPGDGYVENLVTVVVGPFWGISAKKVKPCGNDTAQPLNP